MAAIATEHRYPCDQCGAELRFAPGQSVLKCDHCGYEQTIRIAGDGPWAGNAKPFRELDLSRGLADDLPAAASEDVRATNCTNCGAVVELQGATHAKECPICATPLIVDSGSRRMIKPQALIPFQLDESTARKNLISWLGSLWFAPNRLLEFTRAGRAMTGVYVPYWTFDADTASRYTGQRGEHYYETRTVTVNVNGKSERRTEQVQKTRWYPASGRVSRQFDDVLVIAATSLPARLGEGLEPWDLSGLKPYDPSFLAGLQAEGYTIVLADGHETGRKKMDAVIYNDVCRDIGGDVQRVDNINTDYDRETFKHILLPVWMAAYKYNGKSFRFLVNGQTGEVQGERPWSVWKIMFAVLGAAILIGGGLYGYYLYDPGAFQ
jgi:DNA-directed RNA polymerase subunit RPC12/RpoP